MAMRDAAPVMTFGSNGAPIELILDPHWRMFRFEFFDRYYGDAALNSPPAAGHGRRISTPPLWLEGFRTDANAAGADAIVAHPIDPRAVVKAVVELLSVDAAS